MDRQRKKLARNSLALCVSGAIGILILELGLRAAGFPSQSLHSVSATEYEQIPGMWSPDQDFINRDNPKLPYRVRTNSLGLRGPETTLERTRPRVLFIGDSFTFGDFVDDDDTLPAQVQRRLGEAAEVLNGGVGGTTIVDQRAFLERLMVLQPDIVVLVLFENDLSDLSNDPPLHEQFARNRSLKSGTLRPLFLLIRDTASFNAMLLAQARIRARHQVEDDRDRTDGGGEAALYSHEWVASRAKRYAEETASLRDRLSRDGIGLLVAGFPHPFSVRDSDPDRGVPIPDQIRAVARELEGYGIPLIDLRPPLRASGRSLRELYLFPHDGHASPLGYAIAADTLTPHVLALLAESS